MVLKPGKHYVVELVIRSMGAEFEECEVDDIISNALADSGLELIESLPYSEAEGDM